MADVFVSYASEDRETAAALVDILKAQGWSVWWDRDIPAGASWDESIGQGMREARCMIVLWSEHSVASRMVKDEANFAANRDTLVPALIEQVDIPYGYGMLQAANLTDWEGGIDHAGLAQLLAATRRQLGRATVPIQAPLKRRRLVKLGWLAALLAPVPLAALLGLTRPSQFFIRAGIRAREVAFRTASRQTLPGAALAVRELGASGLTLVELPPAADSSLGALAADRLLLRPLPQTSAPPSGPPGANPLVAILSTPRPNGVSLAPLVVADSTLVRFRVESGLTSVLVQGPGVPTATAAVTGRIGVALPGRGRTMDFEPGEVVVRGDSTGLELEFAPLADTATLALAVPVRGLSFTRVDRFRGPEALDEEVSTIHSADITIVSLHRPGPSLGEGEPLLLERATGQLFDLRVTRSHLHMTFEGTVRSLGTGGGAAWRPTRMQIAVQRYPAQVAAGLALYLAGAVFVVVLKRRKK